MRKLFYILVVLIAFIGQSCEQPIESNRSQSSPKTNITSETSEQESQDKVSAESVRLNTDAVIQTANDYEKREVAENMQVDTKREGFLTMDILLYAIIGLFIITILLFIFLFSQLKRLNNRIRYLKCDVKDSINSIDIRTQGNGDKSLNDFAQRLSNIEYKMKNLMKEQIMPSAPTMPIQQVVQPPSNIAPPAPKVMKVLYCDPVNQDGIFDKGDENYRDTYSLFKIEYEQGNTFGTVSFLDTYPTAVRLGIAHKERILKSICEITEENLNPTTIITTQVGRVERTDNGLWKVVEKMKLTIR